LIRPRRINYYKNMKLWVKILFIIGIIIAVLLTSAYLFLALEGKPLITKVLGDLTRRKVTVGYLDVSPPLNIRIKNLEVSGLAKVESVYISPSILGMLFGNIALNDIKLVNPQITLERQKTQAATSEQGTAALLGQVLLPGQKETVSKPSASIPLNTVNPARLVIKHLQISNGKIDVVDHTAGIEGIKLTFKEINLNLVNLYLIPHSVIGNIKLTGKIPWKEGKEEGKIAVDGWFNLYKRDIQATVKVSDIDGIYLYPYYSKWVDLEKARIESAKLNFSSNIQGLDNNLVAACHLELTDIVRKPRAPEEEPAKAEKIADAVLDIFRALNQGKIVLDFTIRTKMDRPEFGFGNIRMAFEDKISKARGSGIRAQDVVAVPGKILEGSVRTAGNLSKAVVDSVFSIFKAVKKGVEDTIRK